MVINITDMADRAIPGGLRVRKTQAALGDAANDSFEVERGLTNHVILIDMNDLMP
jgi:hypothetical protein